MSIYINIYIVSCFPLTYCVDMHMVWSIYHPANPLAPALGCLVEKVRSHLPRETVRRAYSAIFLSPCTAKQGRHIYIKMAEERWWYNILKPMVLGYLMLDWLGYNLVNPTGRTYYQVCIARHAMSIFPIRLFHPYHPQQCFPFLFGHAGGSWWRGCSVIVLNNAWDEGQHRGWHPSLLAKERKKKQQKSEPAWIE